MEKKMMYYVVRYTGSFGYIKPWSAVRDVETFSQQFLTPSIVEGIEKKLFPELLFQKGIHKILRHKLSCRAIDIQQERTQSQGWTRNTRTKTYTREMAILNRGIMLSPDLLLAFANETDALAASIQHICLCRNEDVLLPHNKILQLDESSFDQTAGFELRFEADKPDSFMVGFNRFDENEPMYGCLEIDGDSILTNQ